MNLDYEISLSYFDWFFNIRKILRYGADGFTSPPKEGVLRTFIALGRVEPANLWSNDNANHQTIEVD
jgi:hypothetical protein